MVEIIGVRFVEGGKAYYFDPNGLTVEVGNKVIVETVRGIELGEVSSPNREAGENELVAPLKKVVRMATPEDIEKAEKLKQKEKEAFDVCLDCIAKCKLDMNLVEVEYTFDMSKIVFYFTADGRVDFRELVKELAGIFRMRIELRQIGVRDEAKLLGGIGICGRPFCCSEFLTDFRPVSIKMAKEQSLSLNPTKISGTCGRLMCCLGYEQATYEDLYRRVPSIDSIVETPSGRGIVTDVSLLKELITVRLDDTDAAPVVFKADACKIIKNSGHVKYSADIPDYPQN